MALCSNAFVAQSDRKPRSTEWRRRLHRPHQPNSSRRPPSRSVKSIGHAASRKQVFRLDRQHRSLRLFRSQGWPRRSRLPRRSTAKAAGSSSIRRAAPRRPAASLRLCLGLSRSSPTDDEIEELLTLAGFKSGRRVPAAAIFVASTRPSAAMPISPRCSNAAATSGLTGRRRRALPAGTCVGSVQTRARAPAPSKVGPSRSISGSLTRRSKMPRLPCPST